MKLDCPDCDGSGRRRGYGKLSQKGKWGTVPCPKCNGSGSVEFKPDHRAIRKAKPEHETGRADFGTHADALRRANRAH